jgi:hypothetical protein
MARVASLAFVGFTGLGAAAVATTGCAQLVGIDDTSNTGRINSLALTRTSIGTSVVLSPIDLTGLKASYIVPVADDLSRVPAVPDPAHPGTWTAHLPDPAPVEFTAPPQLLQGLQSYAFPSAALTVAFAELAHPNPTPAPDGAVLTVTAPLDTGTAADEVFDLLTVGAWASRTFTAAELPALGGTQIGPVSFPLASATNLSGRGQFDRWTAQDAVLVLRHSGATLTGVAEAPAFDQTGTDAVTTPVMTRIALDQMLDFKIDPAAVTARFAEVRPKVNSPAMSWNVVAAPGYRQSATSGPVLLSGGLTSTSLGVTAPYGNPFVARDWHSVLTVLASESRPFTPPGATVPVALFAAMQQFLEPTPGAVIDMPAGLPKLISLAGSQLTADGQTIALPQHFVEATFTTDQVNATLFGLFVLDLVPDSAGTSIQREIVFTGSSFEARFDIPPEVFKAGHSYALRAVCTYGGFPGLARGDFTARELPMSQAQLDSAVFTVVP